MEWLYRLGVRLGLCAPPEIDNLKAEEVQEAIPDFRDVINGMQHMVNTINSIQHQHGNDVGEWTMEDFQRFTDACERMGRVNQG